MGVTVQITDAAHQWGYDHFFQGRFGLPTNTSIGGIQSPTFSWGSGEPPVGSPVDAAITTTGGFTIRVAFTLLSESSATLHSMQIYRTATNQLLQSVAGPLSVGTSSLIVSDAALMVGNDVVVGNAYANVLQGWGGNDTLDGGAGLDTAFYSGLSSASRIVRNGSTLTVTGPEGTDTLRNIERVTFADKTIAFDTDGAGGQAYRLYQAAFNRTPDAAGLGFQIKTLDAGWSLKSVAQNFLASPEFSRTFGSLDNSQYVAKLYDNVLHRAPDAGGLAFHVGALANGTVDRAQLLVNFSESPENQAALIGVIQNGMSYTGT